LSKKLRLALPFRAYQNIGKGHNLFHGQNQIDDLLSLARIFHESPAATTLRSWISDFRFQIEGCLMQTGYLSKTRMQL
jgi:hypothetical protein